MSINLDMLVFMILVGFWMFAELEGNLKVRHPAQWASGGSLCFAATDEETTLCATVCQSNPFPLLLRRKKSRVHFDRG
jgi:hypothetical protein